jgi:hypothetical protein
VRLPLAMFSVSLLVHVHRLTGSFMVADAASGAYVIVRGLTSPELGRLVDSPGQTLVLIGCGAASAILLVTVALLPAAPQQGSSGSARPADGIALMRAAGMTPTGHGSDLAALAALAAADEHRIPQGLQLH